MHGVPFEVSTPAQVEEALKILAAKKVDLVKIWVDDHLGKEPKISIDLCKLIIAGAKKRGLPVAAHVFFTWTTPSGWWTRAFTAWLIRSATRPWTRRSFNR